MANKKKNASANPNLDTVKDVFRKNRHITNRIQQKTVFEATDLSEKYYARRIKAVMHLLPEMKRAYAAKISGDGYGQRVCRGGLLSEHYI